MKLATYDETAKEGKLIPRGDYMFRLDNIKVVPKPEQYVDPGGNPDQWEWLWSINDGPQAEATFKQWTNCTINPGSTAKPWAEALLGRFLKNGEVLDDQDLIGRTMEGHLAEHTTKNGKVVNRITEVLSGPKGEPEPIPPVLREEDGWPRRFQAACVTVMNANGFNRDQLKAELRKAFPGYTEFSKLHKDAQGPVLEWIEREAKRVPEPEGELAF